MNTYWFFDSALKRDTCGAKNIPGKLIKDSRQRGQSYSRLIEG